MKKILILTLTLTLLSSVSLTAFASTKPFSKSSTESIEMNSDKNLNDLLNSDLADYGKLELLDENDIPDEATVQEFNSWDEAYAYLDNINNTIKNSTSISNSKYTIKIYASVPSTDYYSVKPITIPSGSGSDEYTVDFDVPGFSGQTITSSHYIEYSNNKITSSSRGSDINGVGIANWKQTYSGLQKEDGNWKSIVRGKWGYFVSVNGQTVGYSYSLELQLLCKPR